MKKGMCALLFISGLILCVVTACAEPGKVPITAVITFDCTETNIPPDDILHYRTGTFMMNVNFTLKELQDEVTNYWGHTFYGLNSWTIDWTGDNTYAMTVKATKY